MAWLHVSAAAAIAPRASSFGQDFREPRSPPILFAPFAAIAAFQSPCPLAGAPHPAILLVDHIILFFIDSMKNGDLHGVRFHFLKYRRGVFWPGPGVFLPPAPAAHHAFCDPPPPPRSALRGPAPPQPQLFPPSPQRKYLL